MAVLSRSYTTSAVNATPLTPLSFRAHRLCLGWVRSGTDIAYFANPYPRHVSGPGGPTSGEGNNTYYTAGGWVKECGKSLQDVQKQGIDLGSSVEKLPSDATIIGWASELLGIGAAVGAAPSAK